jgi:hypothetical protein
MFERQNQARIKQQTGVALTFAQTKPTEAQIAADRSACITDVLIDP